MDLQLPSIPSLFIFIFFIFMILKIGKKRSGSAMNLPPGPSKLPVIGNLHQIASTAPHHRLRELANKYGPIMYLRLGEFPHIVFSSAESSKEILKTHDILFAQRPPTYTAVVLTYNCTDIGFAPYGDYWRQLRKICVLELLSVKRVRAYRSIPEEEVMKLIRSIHSREGSAIDLNKDLISMTYCVTSRAAFGKVWKGQDVFLPVVKELLEAGSGFSLSDLYPSLEVLHVITGMRRKLLRCHKKIDGLLENIINEHRTRTAGATRSGTAAEDEEVDLVDVLLNLQDHGDLEFPLTTDNIKAVIMDLFIAGSETSSTAVEWAMSELVKNPQVMKKAQAEVRECIGSSGLVDEESIRGLQYLKLVIKENFRLHPPVPLLLPRECRETCQINGYDIPFKSRVFINAWAIGRDAKYWTDPERFYPERFLNSSIDYKGNDFELIPFGAGRKMCPGLLFGVANVELLLAQLLYHFDWKLPNGMPPESMDMKEAFGATLKRKNALCLIPTPYIAPVN